ncbi:hypothetical protein [Planomonospora alba]|uniref:hypothetical protein n=1 Tax=Planomonospora alba TaxID=161354 RepID=UPI0031F166DD
MIERADQLVLEYVSRAADAAHGVLRQDQRLDFVRRLRERIDAERRGADSPAAVAKVLAGFGDPVALVRREARRLSEEAAPPPADRAENPAPAAPPPVPPAPPPVPPASARRGREVPPEAARSREEALRWLADHGPGARPVRRPGIVRRAGPWRRTSVPPPGPAGPGEPWSPPGGAARNRLDAVEVLAAHRHETAGVAVLVLAGLLVPLAPVPVGIVPLPLLVWAAGALVVLSAPGWERADRVAGVAAPVLSYTAGGALVALVRSGGGSDRTVAEFFDVSGPMFVLGTAAGVFRLVRRLLDPPLPDPGRSRPGRSR